MKILELERKESLLRSQALLMIARNSNKKYIIDKVLKRFIKCIVKNG